MSISARMQRFLPALLLGAVLALFLWGSARHSRMVNTDVTSFDQNAYLYYGRLLHETGYEYVGDRNRMPAYPMLLSLIYTPDWSEQDFFVAAKTANRIFSAFLLLVLWFILAGQLRKYTAANVFLVAVFTVFVFKAAYVQAEVLFYLLNFVLFLLLCRIWIKPDFRWAIATGVLAGLTHLTKASVLPELLAFLVFGCLKTAMEAWPRNRHLDSKSSWQKRSASLVFLTLCFILTILPYSLTSKKIFGQYLYNVNSTFYFWVDTVQEWKEGPKAHGDRFGWPDLPAEQIPNAAHYIKKYGVGHILERLATGGRTMIQACRHSFGFFKYLMAYGLFFLFMILHNRTWVRLWLKKNILLVLFIASVFAGYTILMAWWNYLGPQVRHILAFLLPFLFTVAFALEQLPNRTLRLGKRLNSVDGLWLFNIVVSVMVFYDMYVNLFYHVTTMVAGT
jgi:hypothetical protein